MAEELLFVYGSLRSGQSAHQLLHGCSRQPDGVLVGCELIEHAGYPMLQPGDQAVRGEVYGVSPAHWRALDDWEEAPEVYQRVQRQLQDGRVVWVYQQPQSATEADCGK